MWYKHLREMNHDVDVCLCCVNTIKMDDFLIILSLSLTNERTS